MGVAWGDRRPRCEVCRSVLDLRARLLGEAVCRRCDHEFPVIERKNAGEGKQLPVEACSPCRFPSPVRSLR